MDSDVSTNSDTEAKDEHCSSGEYNSWIDVQKNLNVEDDESTKSRTVSESSSSSNESQRFDCDKDEYLPEINILLMGETGVGKSTFINAFLNYLTFDTLAEAANADLNFLVPVMFTIASEDLANKVVVQIGQSDDESSKIGQSATLQTKSYVFHAGNYLVRIIDTPGLGNTAGIELDKENFENIFSYIAELKTLHAVCFLMQPNNSRISALFEYCIRQFLSRLQKSASENIIFLFTNARGTFYRPGDTLPALNEILTDIKTKPPYVDIKFKKRNVFCLDNEAFRFLAALKEGANFDDREKSDFEESWKRSSEECWRMLKYIIGEKDGEGLRPHQIQNTISVNEAKRLITQLSQPLVDVIEVIQSNLTALKKQQEILEGYEGNLDQLKENLYIPVISIRGEELEDPKTVCTAAKCVETVQVNGVLLVNYKQVCHDACNMSQFPTKIVGSSQLANCSVMGEADSCNICGCSYTVHRHIYCLAKIYDEKIINEDVQDEIEAETESVNLAKEQIQILEKRIKEYEQEEKILIETAAKFAYFLQHNAITVYADAFKEYLEYLIDRENSFGENSDTTRTDHYQEVLDQYQSAINQLNEELTETQTFNPDVTSVVGAEDITMIVFQLYSLNHIGASIRELFQKQTRARKHEIWNLQEHVYRKTHFQKLQFHFKN